METILEDLKELGAVWGVRVVAAIVIFIVGRWIAGLVRKLVSKLMAKKKTDEAVISFVGNLVYTVLMVFIFIAVLAKIGIQTTSFIAVIGAAGLAIGLALQGSLASSCCGNG